MSTRFMDTRTGAGGRAAGPVPAYGSTALQISDNQGVPAQGVTAVALNLTETHDAAAGFVTAYPDGTALPHASNLNHQGNQTVPNLVIVPLGADGKVRFYNGSNRSTDLVADIEGYYTSTPGLAFVPAQVWNNMYPIPQPGPARILDTRSGLAPQTTMSKGPLKPYGWVKMQMPSFYNQSDNTLQALVLNMTVVNPATSGWLWMDYLTQESTATGSPTSAANYEPHQAVSNAFIPMLENNGTSLSLQNHSSGTADLLADVAGYFA